jgi:hypothetical protein
LPGSTSLRGGTSWRGSTSWLHRTQSPARANAAVPSAYSSGPACSRGQGALRTLIGDAPVRESSAWLRAI